MQIIGDVPQLTVAFIRRKAPYFVGDSLTDSVTFWESMQYWGKIIGVAVALMMGGGFGAWSWVCWWAICSTKPAAENGVVCQPAGTAGAVFATTFEVMGHLTKSKDG